ncbi:uncharacterized protein LOC144164728 [Haemaphysalis longicornis]
MFGSALRDASVASGWQQRADDGAPYCWTPCDASWASPAAPPADEEESLECIPQERSVLIKNCLKLTIRQRREALGLGDIAPEYKAPAHDNLTKEDEEKRNRRRERNKIAASKCRNRKKERTVRLCEESEGLQRGNEELRRELQRLRLEVQHLSQLLRLHVCLGVPSQQSSGACLPGGGQALL